MTATVLVSQNRAISMARDATTARVLALELLAAHVAAAEAARRDWEGAHQAAAKNDKYLDLVARTAADQHATMEITGMAEQAARRRRHCARPCSGPPWRRRRWPFRPGALSRS